jgi:hypothetical protein
MNVITVFVEGEGMTEAEREALRAEIREGVARFMSPTAPAVVPAPQLPLPGVVGEGEGIGAPDDFRAQAWGIVGDGGPYPGDARTLAIMAGKLDQAMELLVLVHEVTFNPGDVLDPVAVIARVREAARALRAGRAMQGPGGSVQPHPMAEPGHSGGTHAGDASP